MQNDYGKLKKCLVGNDLGFDNNISKFIYQHYGWGSKDITFKERNKQLNELEKLLNEKNIKTIRPFEVNKVDYINYNKQKIPLAPCANPRDLALIYNNKIIYTPRKVYRQGEFLLLKDVLDKELKGYKIYDLGISDDNLDAACFLKLGKDCIVNVKTDKQKEHLNKIKVILPDINFIEVDICHSHIDGHLVALNNEVFLTTIKNIEEKIPYLKNKNIIYTNDSINVLSLDDYSVVISKGSDDLKNKLIGNNFNIIEIDLQDSVFFRGGIHCSTLCLERL